MTLFTIKTFALPFIAFVIIGSFSIASTASATYSQNDYRIYDNTDAQTPTDPWPPGATNLSENQAAVDVNGVNDGDVIRLRMTVNVTDSAESGDDFKLQYKLGETCSAIGTWTDVGNTSGSEAWRGYVNATPTDGATLSSLLISTADVYGTYEESNNSATMPSTINVGQDGEWDWVVENNNADAGTYCFRMVLSNGTELSSYSDYPTAESIGYSPVASDWRWYSDTNNETPSNALQSENTEPVGIKRDSPLKLRYLITDASGTGGTNVKFKMEYSTQSDFSSDVHAITEINNCTSSSLWCYYDGVDNDGDSITTTVLSNADSAGVHNESGDNPSTFDPPANNDVEFEFTLVPIQPDKGTEYFFRPYYAGVGNVELESGSTYAKLRTVDPYIAFSYTGIDANTTLEGETTTVSTIGPTLDFGTQSLTTPTIAAHKLTVTMDGLGYMTFIRANGPFANASADEITQIGYTNASPGAWSFTPSATTPSAFGYHTSDGLLSNDSTRFNADDTWAGLTNDSEEISFSTGPILEDITYILYKMEIGTMQPAGSYSTEITYSIVPMY